VPIATNAVHSPWGIAFNEAQRMALKNNDLKKGLEAARAIALLSYRSYETFSQTQLDQDHRTDGFSASSYQQYQGTKLSNRFSPFSYYYLSKAMDSHNVGVGFGQVESALNTIRSKTIVIGVDSDLLFPPHEQQLIADNIDLASFHIVSSQYGHDGFLIETDQISNILTQHV
jgi:homoserine O-acetyltransferase